MQTVLVVLDGETKIDETLHCDASAVRAKLGDIYDGLDGITTWRREPEGVVAATYGAGAGESIVADADVPAVVLAALDAEPVAESGSWIYSIDLSKYYDPTDEQGAIVATRFPGDCAVSGDDVIGADTDAECHAEIRRRLYEDWAAAEYTDDEGALIPFRDLDPPVEFRTARVTQ